MAGVGESAGGKWRQLYLNNNKKKVLLIGTLFSRGVLSLLRNAT